MVDRGVLLQLVKQKCVAVFLEQIQLYVCIAKFSHISQVSSERWVDLEIIQATFTHEENWVVIIDQL